MKHKVVKRGLFGAVLVFLVMLGCNQDDFYGTEKPQQQDTKEIVIKDISFEEFSRRLNTMEKKPDIERFMSPSQGMEHYKTTGGQDFVIYTDEIREITKGDYTSYTMYLQTPDTIKRPV